MNRTKLVNPVLTERKQNKVNTAKIIFYLFTFVFLLVSCNTTQPPPGSKGEIQLTMEDASSTEVWLNVKTQNITLPAELKLFREDSVTQIINLSYTDTLLYDSGLQPNKAYNYKAAYTGGSAGGGQTIQSQTVTATTMDTTSHNFTWQTFTFGGANGSSVLNDVAIISENNIWAVGEIHTAETDQFDSNGVWVQPYNAVHWDGNSWGLKRIIVNFRGNATFIPLEGIFAFAFNDIWLVGSLPIHGDGNSWQIYDVRNITNSNLSLSKAWGSSSDNMYFVGRGGSIAHYNGSTWTKINSGTDFNIYDIWGDYDEKEGKYEIMADGTSSQSHERVILGIKKLSAVKVSSQGINWALGGIWFESNKNYYVIGDGIYYKHLISDKQWKTLNITNVVTTAIDGKGANDIIIAGSFGEVLHYNGRSWKSYKGNALPNEANLMKSISFKGNTACVVGTNGYEAILYLGKRN